jgi:hypothetical protein
MLEGTAVPDKAIDDMSNQGDMDVDDDDDKGKYERLFVTPPIWRNFTPNCERDLVATVANGVHLNCIGYLRVLS